MKNKKAILVMIIVLAILAASSFFQDNRKLDGQFITIAAAGDIAVEGGKQQQTAQLISKINPVKVLTLGDNVYENGTLAEFNKYYHPSWGKFLSITAPSPGNHEYNTPDAEGYFSYFGNLAGEYGKGYYGFDLNDWHIISLNSERIDDVQLEWLKTELQTIDKPCVLAFWHKPLFSSGAHGGEIVVKQFWDILYDKGADIILNGHDHSYERFSKQNPSGLKDRKGIREFIVGTGGNVLRDRIHYSRNSEFFILEHGVLFLDLYDNGYNAYFQTIDGEIKDQVLNQECNKK
jgi:hypothetical protein